MSPKFCSENTIACSGAAFSVKCKVCHSLARKLPTWNRSRDTSGRLRPPLITLTIAESL